METNNNIEQAVKTLKMKAGISINEKDDYLTIIIKSVISELQEVQGMKNLDINNMSDFMLVVDYAEWRYSSRGEGGFYEFRAPNGEGANVLPQHLAWRIKNRFLKKGMINNEAK